MWETLVDLTSLRADFPFLEKNPQMVYLDSAATTQKPKSVIESLVRFYSQDYGTVHRAVYTLAQNATELFAQARRKVQHFIHAASDREIVFTRGTTNSLNLIATAFGKRFLQPGDVVMLSQIEHHSNIIPWQKICEEKGASLRIIPVNDQGEIIFEEFENLLDKKVKIVSLSHVSNVLGTIHPIGKIIHAAHRVGAYVCVDGAQAIAHLPVDVQALDADFYVFSGHKLYGPTGIGVLYGKEELLEKLPPVEYGGGMVEEVSFVKSSYQSSPFKFEAGTPMIAEAIALGSAIDYLNLVGMEAICTWEKELLDYATQKMLAIPGLQIFGPLSKKGVIISFVVEGVHPLDIATFLDFHHVAIRSGHHCSQPTMECFGVSSMARISFALYNTKEEIDRFIEALKSVLKTFEKNFS